MSPRTAKARWATDEAAAVQLAHGSCATECLRTPQSSTHYARQHRPSNATEISVSSERDILRDVTTTGWGVGSFSGRSHASAFDHSLPLPSIAIAARPWRCPSPSHNPRLTASQPQRPHFHPQNTRSTPLIAHTPMLMAMLHSHHSPRTWPDVKLGGKLGR